MLFVGHPDGWSITEYGLIVRIQLCRQTYAQVLQGGSFVNNRQEFNMWAATTVGSNTNRLCIKLSGSVTHELRGICRASLGLTP